MFGYNRDLLESLGFSKDFLDKARLARIFPQFDLVENEGSWYGCLKDKKIPELNIHVKTNDRDNYKFSVNWPHSNLTGNWYKPSDGDSYVIKVSKSRDDAAICKDVERRLLSRVYPVLPIMLEKKIEAEKQKLAFKEKVREYSVRYDGRVPAEHAQCWNSGEISVYKKGIHSIKINEWDGKIKIETESLPEELALKVLELLAAKAVG